MSKTRTPECTEVVSVLMALEPSSYEKHKEAIQTLSPDFQIEHIQPDDLINVSYEFSVYYFNVVKQLQAVLEICSDPDVIVASSCPALEAGRIVIYEALKKLDNVIQHVKGRE